MSHQSSKLRASVTTFSPGPVQQVDIREPVDTMPSDYQPPGTDDDEPQSLEEALTG